MPTSASGTYRANVLVSAGDFVQGEAQEFVFHPPKWSAWVPAVPSMMMVLNLLILITFIALIWRKSSQRV